MYTHVYVRIVVSTIGNSNRKHTSRTDHTVNRPAQSVTHLHNMQLPYVHITVPRAIIFAASISRKNTLLIVSPLAIS